VFLKFHTEVAFHRWSMDYLMLYRLRQDPEKIAQTVIASVRRILPHLTLDQRQRLSQFQFKTEVDLSFGGGDGPTVPVLYGDPSDPYLRYDEDFMKASTPEGERALDELRRAVYVERREIAIEAGDLVVIDNRRDVHARSDFKAHYDGTDRWLLRLGVLRDLRPALDDCLSGTRIIARDRFTTL